MNTKRLILILALAYFVLTNLTIGLSVQQVYADTAANNKLQQELDAARAIQGATDRYLELNGIQGNYEVEQHGNSVTVHASFTVIGSGT